MATVTYKNQPGIDASGGTVPLAGTTHIYTVSKLLWPEAVEEFINGLLPKPTLHLCHGKSSIGDVRLDLYEESTDVRGDAARLPFKDNEFACILADPPYNGNFQWNHDVLSEMARVAKERFILQHWFIPANKHGKFKKDWGWKLTGLYVWQPKTYFGRVQVVSVFDHE